MAATATESSALMLSLNKFLIPSKVRVEGNMISTCITRE